MANFFATANIPIVVDNFRNRFNNVTTHFFLTHCHSDHLTGLSDSFDSGNIYCSVISKKLLLTYFNIKPSLIISLEMDTTHSISLTNDITMNVTLIPAGHCPGSVMYLFDGHFGRYLHTGDFRYTESLHKIPALQSPPIDKLILDITFVDPIWKNFPSKNDAISQILEIIKSKDSDVEVYIECEMLGTEEIFKAIASEFDSLIHVNAEKYAEMLCIPHISHIFTMDEWESRFHACKVQTFSSLLSESPKGYRKNSVNKFQLKDALLIKPSTQWFGTGGRAMSIHKYMNKPAFVDGVWHVLYSIHSSHKELLEFVEFLAPSAVIPIAAQSKEALKYFEPFLNKKKLALPEFSTKLSITSILPPSDKFKDNNTTSFSETESSESQNSLPSLLQTGKRSAQFNLEEIEDSSDEEYKELLNTKVKQGRRIPLQVIKSPTIRSEKDERVANFDMTRRKKLKTDENTEEFQFSMDCKEDHASSQKDTSNTHEEQKRNLLCQESPDLLLSAPNSSFTQSEDTIL